MSAIYQGFSEKTKLLIIILSAFIALANLSIAWYVADKALDEIPMSASDVTEIKDLSSDLNDGLVYSNNMSLRVHAINTQVHLKGVTNKQSIIVVSIGSGFAFMAIGFALFLIGADGALQVKQESTDSRLMISATAPGVACFLFAAVLIAFGVSREYKLQLGKAPLISGVPVANSSIPVDNNSDADFPDP